MRTTFGLWMAMIRSFMKGEIPRWFIERRGAYKKWRKDYVAKNKGGSSGKMMLFGRRVYIQPEFIKKARRTSLHK